MSSENVGCLGFLFGWLRDSNAPAGTARLPYRVQQSFMTKAEQSFYHVLRQASGDRFAIFAQVGLGDLFFVAHKEQRLSWRNRIASKRLDFLLCDPQTLQPLAGIELDDSSHERPARRERDAFIDRMFEDAGLPLIHMPARRSYTVEDLRDSLRIALTMGEREVATSSPGRQASGGAPACPRCGLPMVLRTVRKGEKSGSQFWGCSNYPRCQQTVPLEQG